MSESAFGPVWLDISRLLHRALAGGLTGIDRVELAYAQTLSRTARDRLRFVTLTPWGRLVFLPHRVSLAFVEAIASRWTRGNGRRASAMAIRLLAASATARSARSARRAVYLLVSHRHLASPAAVGKALSTTGAAFVPLIHDLIPITHPEYVKAGASERHARRMATVAAFADGVLANSEDTAAAMAPYLRHGVPVLAPPLGIRARPRSAISPTRGSDPYFVCVGTIEPRKNHILLLNLWRRLAELGTEPMPRLVIVGRRGWENENVVDMLERCGAIKPHVDELSGVPDEMMDTLMAGARAMLMPSFAEGYGIPVAEALSGGVPVLASDLGALREVGSGIPEFLDPMDARGWLDAVLDYAAPDSVRRAAQMSRMGSWTGPTWDDHVGAALAFADDAASRCRRPMHRAA